jgi:hypothetical protein
VPRIGGRDAEDLRPLLHALTVRANPREPRGCKR